MKTSAKQNQIESLRADLILATPEDAQAAENANELPASNLYIPASHLKALSPDKPLVVGMRGAGKSYWWLQLQKSDLLPLIYGSQAHSQIQLECKPGFGKNTNPADAPSRKILQQLIQKGFDAEDIWRAVIARHVTPTDNAIPERQKDWEGRVKWVVEHVEQFQRDLYKFDRELQQNKKQIIILFDSLDDAADSWENKKNLLKGLFRTLVDLRTYRAIRGKVFIRPDMLTSDVTNFPDASKLLSERVDLIWSRADLYSLLWQTFGNSSKAFRDWSTLQYKQVWKQTKGIWQIPSELRTDETLQRKVFHGLAGEWMGKDARRGFPYTYFLNHLGDAKVQVSPRSFLVAIHKAAEVTQEKYADARYPLHYEAIKTGLQHASTIRKAELQVEYPWVEVAMHMLKERIILPCEWKDIKKIWQKENLLQKLQDTSIKPERLGEGLEGIRDEMRTIAIFEDAKDGIRINIPDVFRIGYGLGRKGGIRPVR